VINLRGTVLPLVDTRVKFGMSETEYTANTCILVLDIDMDNDTVQVGALVDSVQEVLELNDKEILPPPSIGSKYKSEFIEGMARSNDQFIMILNMDMIFSTDELAMLRDTTSEQEEQLAEESEEAEK